MSETAPGCALYGCALTISDKSETTQRPMLMRGGLSGRVYIVTAYTDLGNDRFDAIAKHDVSEAFEALSAQGTLPAAEARITTAIKLCDEAKATGATSNTLLLIKRALLGSTEVSR